MHRDWISYVQLLLRRLIFNLKVAHRELGTLHIRIVLVVVVVLHPLPDILQPRHRLPFLLRILHQPQSLQQRRRRRLDVDVVARPDEVEDALPVDVRLVLRRADDAVRRRLEVARRPEVQRVADIAHDAAVHGRHVPPLALLRLDLQARDVLAPQQRERAKVRVGARPRVLDPRVVGGGPRVVGHVADVVLAGQGVGVARGEVVLGELEDDGEEGEDFAGEVEGFLWEGSRLLVTSEKDRSIKGEVQNQG